MWVECIIVVLILIVAYQASGYVANWWHGGGIPTMVRLLPVDMRAPTHYVVTSTPQPNGISMVAWSPIKLCAVAQNIRYYTMAGTAPHWENLPTAAGRYCYINNVWQPLTQFASGVINGVTMNYYTFSAYAGALPKLPDGITSPLPATASASTADAAIDEMDTAAPPVTSNETFSTIRICPKGFHLEGGSCRLCPVVGGQPVC